MHMKRFGVALLVIVFFTAFVHADQNGLKKEILVDSSWPTIIGGSEADPSDWPWMAALVESNLYYYDSVCGGSLVAPQWIITAAHCVQDFNGNTIKPSEIDVVLGVHDLSKDTGERIKVKRIIVHPTYAVEDDPDIALLELEDSVSIDPVSLYTGNDSLAGVMATVLGWGTTATDNYSDTLQEVEMPVVSNEVCNLAFSEVEIPITEYMLCAGYNEGGKDSCQGDSGGPLVVQVDGQWKLAGIVSFGPPGDCAQPGFYGVYTRISSVIDFIDDYIGINTPSTGIETEKLYFPHIALDGRWETEICVVNGGNGVIEGAFYGYDDNGNLISASAGSIQLNPNARIVYQAGSHFTQADAISYAVFEYTGTGAVGYLKFYTDDKLRAALPAAVETNDGDIHIPHIDSGENWWTGIGLVNTNSSAKTVRFDFDNGATVSLVVPPNGHKAVLIRDLFNGVPQPDIHYGIIQNTEGIVAMELFGSTAQSSESYLCGVLLTDDTSNTLIYPHIADRVDWWTGIGAYSSAADTANIAITAYDVEGNVLGVVNESIGGNGSFVINESNLGLPGNSAWLRLETGTAIGGFELFGSQNGQQLGGLNVVGISNAGASVSSGIGIFASVETNGQTTIVIVNIDDVAAAVVLTGYNDNGDTVVSKTVSIAPKAKLTANESDLFGDVAGVTHIGYTSGASVVAMQVDASSSGWMLDALPALATDSN